MKYEWQDLPKPMSCFTIRNATMKNLNTGEIVQHYSANTKIVVVQKCVTPTNTYYRTESARHHYLNYAFEASAFGLANEKAPSARISKVNSQHIRTTEKKPKVSHSSSAEKQKSTQKATPTEDGERAWHKGVFGKILRRIKK